MKTTFRKIKDCQPSPYSWEKLISYYNPFSLDEEISIKEIVESNGIDDAIWALWVVDDTEALISLSIDLAEAVLHVYEKHFPGDTRVRVCIDACKKYIRGEISESELIEKKKGAYNAYDVAYDNGVSDDAFDAAARVAVQAARAADANIAFAARAANANIAFTAHAAIDATRAARAACEAASNADKSDRGRETIKNILLKY
jgi:hypothetical protein